MSNDELSDELVALEGRLGEVEDAADALSEKIEELDGVLADLLLSFDKFKRSTTEDLDTIKKTLYIASNPEEADKLGQLKDAYEKYIFTRNLVLGKGK